MPIFIFKKRLLTFFLNHKFSKKIVPSHPTNFLTHQLKKFVLKKKDLKNAFFQKNSCGNKNFFKNLVDGC